MIKFRIEETEYVVPEFINIENYVKIYKVKDLFSDDYFMAKIVNLVTGAPVEDLLQADYEEVSYLASYIMSLIPTEVPKFQDRFELDGVKYGFFPNWQDLSYAEFVDMDTISTKKPDEVLDMIHILAAIMYRPIINEETQHNYTIEKYDVELMKKRAEIFKKKLDIKYVLGAQFFFINFANRFLGYSRLSSIPKLSIWQKIKLLWIMRKWIWGAIFKKHMDGSLSQTKLLETILQNTKLFTNRN